MITDCEATLRPNYVNGLYIVTAIYNGNTYHAKVYINH